MLWEGSRNGWYVRLGCKQRSRRNNLEKMKNLKIQKLSIMILVCLGACLTTKSEEKKNVKLAPQQRLQGAKDTIPVVELRRVDKVSGKGWRVEQK